METMLTTYNANTTTQTYDQIQATLDGAKRSLQSGIKQGRTQMGKAVETGKNTIAYSAAIVATPVIVASIVAYHTVKTLLPKRALGMLTVLGLVVVASVVRAL